MVAESVSVKREVNLLDHHYEWFKCDQSLFLSLGGLQGIPSVGLAIVVHHGAPHMRRGRWWEQADLPLLYK